MRLEAKGAGRKNYRNYRNRKEQGRGTSVVQSVPFEHRLQLNSDLTTVEPVLQRLDLDHRVISVRVERRVSSIVRFESMEGAISVFLSFRFSSRALSSRVCLPYG